MLPGFFTVDVEEWYHILDCPSVSPIDTWESLESRVAASLEWMLEMLGESGVRATFFWLGWLAERHKALVRRCLDAGHEVASHSYGHILAYEVGRNEFLRDIDRAKRTLEDITGQAILGFRAPGFGITEDAGWAFDVIKEAGYAYDSSIFPSSRGHGGISGATLGPHRIETHAGPLVELPMSIVKLLGYRANLFGGGYLRISPLWLIRWGIRRLRSKGHPLTVYIHPREVDPDHPRLPLRAKRRFKSYVNLKSTKAKLEWLCRNHSFCTMRDFVDRFFPADGPGTGAGDVAT